MISDSRLRYLYEAARLGTMRAASDALDVAPSSISRQIASLEQQLGTALIEKRRRGVILTEAGEAVCAYYREKSALEEAFLSNIDDLKSLRAGKVRLAVGEAFVIPEFNDMLTQFMNQYPDIAIDVAIANTHQVVQAVLRDEAHLGLIFDTPQEPKIHVGLSRPQPLLLVVAPDHALADAKKVTLKTIAGLPIGLTESEFRIRQILREAEAEERVFLQPDLTTNSFALLRQFVKTGRGASIMPSLVVYPDVQAGELVTIPIANRLLDSTKTNLITRAERQLPTGAARLMDCVSHWLKNILA